MKNLSKALLVLSALLIASAPSFAADDKKVEKKVEKTETTVEETVDTDVVETPASN